MTNCTNFTTMEEFIEYWNSCSLECLQEIATKYGVSYELADSKEKLIEKLANAMKEYC